MSVFWIRDDDLTNINSEIKQLLDFCGIFQIEIALAIIPKKMDSDLFFLCKDYPFVKIWQHGLEHSNRACKAQKKSEFPVFDPHQYKDILLQKKRMEDCFGDFFQPVFVPPWNRLDPSWSDPILNHFSHISGFGASDKDQFHHTNLDIIDWKIRHIKPLEILMKEFSNLQKKGESSIGILTHHWMHKEEGWKILSDFLVETQHVKVV
jgi:hypothetical protein